MFFIGTAPILIALSLRSALPESPRWLASRNRLDEANSAIDRIEQEIEKSSGSKLPAPTEWVPADTKRASWRDIVGPDYLRRSIVVWIIWFATFFITYGLGTCLPTLYRTVFNLPLETSLRYATIGSLMQLVGGITAGFVIDRLGRRRLFMIAFFGAATALVALWFVGFDFGHAICDLQRYRLLLCRIGRARRVSLRSGRCSPTRARAFATALGTAWLRLASMLGPLVIGFFVAGEIANVFLIFASGALVAGVAVTLFAIETANRRWRRFLSRRR